MADGAIARRTKSDNELGAILDTVADIVFAAVCFVKILPTMQFPVWLWIWIVIIAIIKIGNLVWVLICNKKLISLHTILNKATGFLLFLFPLTLGFIEPVYSSAAVCLIATLSAIDEAWHIKMSKEGYEVEINFDKETGTFRGIATRGGETERGTTAVSTERDSDSM